MLSQRPQQAFIIIISGLLALVPLGILLLIPTASLGLAALLIAATVLLSLPCWLIIADIRHDQMEARGRALQAHMQAGYRVIERRAIRRKYILDDGTVEYVFASGPGSIERIWLHERDEQQMLPEVPMKEKIAKEFDANDYRDKEDENVKRARLRELLAWIYEQIAKGDGYDQKPGRKAFPGTYDQDMNHLARLGFLVGHTTGHTGRPAILDPDAGLAAWEMQGE